MAASAAPAWSPLAPLTQPLREEIARTETELASLPVFPVNSSPWTLGYSSAQHETPELPVRIDITIPQAADVDLVVLMPAIFTNQRNQVRAYGFPVRFSVDRLLSDGTTDRIADFLERDYPAPGVEPQFFPCEGTRPTTGLRITVTQLASNPTWWHASHLVAFSECYAFSGDRNVALNGVVEATSSFEFSYAWSKRCLTDGFTLFSPIFHDLTDPEDNFNVKGDSIRLALDLGVARRIDEFRLWPVVHSVQHNFPPSSGIGFPSSILIEIAQNEDFSDAKVLFEQKSISQRPASGPLMQRTEPQVGRYVRLTLANGLPDFRQDGLKQIALGEIQLLENGRDVSQGREFRALDRRAQPDGIGRLTDGRSNEGGILPVRDWLVQFKRRVEVYKSLTSLRTRLNAAHQKEKERAKIILIALVVLMVLLLQSIWVIRVRARRRWERVREQIGCDLHDELGANVSSLAHIAELLAETIVKPTDTQARLLGNFLENARLTSRDARQLVRLVESDDTQRDLNARLREVAEQILGTIPATFRLSDARCFRRLDPLTRWNLVLFYKEALNNVIRHAGSGSVEVITRVDDGRMQLIVIDDGVGFPENSSPPRHLANRARILGGDLAISSAPKQGTRVTLSFTSKST